MITVLVYPTCSTCRKATNWLKTQEIEARIRPIVDEPPTVEELTAWYARTDQPIQKLFNTSGKRYRELKLKETVASAPESDLLQLLASDPMLVKRPVLVTADRAWFGFHEDTWRSILNMG